MTKKDTIQIMAILREVYPSYYGRKTRDELNITIDLWAEMFAESGSSFSGTAGSRLQNG